MRWRAGRLADDGQPTPFALQLNAAYKASDSLLTQLSEAYSADITQC